MSGADTHEESKPTIAEGVTYRGSGDNFRRSGASAVRLSLVGLFLGAFAVGTDGFMIAGLLPRIAHDFHTSILTAAQLVTVFSIGYAVGAPVLASLFHRVDRRTLLVVGLVGLAATNAAAALTPGLAGLFVARLTAALAAGVYSPTAAVVAVGLASPKRRGRALSVITAGLTLSIVTGVPLGNLVGEQWGWRATFGGVAVLSAILAVGLYAILPRIAASATATTLLQRIAALGQPGVRRVLATTLLGILAGYLGYTYVAPISQAMGATTSESLAVVLVCFGAGAAVGSSLAGAAVDRYGQVLVVRIGALIQTLALATLAAGDAADIHLGVLPVAIAFILLGIGSWTYNAPQQHRLVELSPENATTVVSLNSSAIYAGIGLSGALGALTSSAGSAFTSTGGPTLTCVTGAVIALATAVMAGRRR
jgi:predicted MFS family arabinose efflux permease